MDIYTCTCMCTCTCAGIGRTYTCTCTDRISDPSSTTSSSNGYCNLIILDLPGAKYLSFTII